MIRRFVRAGVTAAALVVSAGIAPAADLDYSTKDSNLEPYAPYYYHRDTPRQGQYHEEKYDERRYAEPRPEAPGAAERFSVALDHARLALRLQGDTRKTVVEFRKHFGWYTRGMHHASDLRARLFQVESMLEAEAIFGEYLAPVAGVA